MKTFLMAMACALCATTATAQDWPNDWPPKDFPWPVLWPVNRSPEVTSLRLGKDFLASFNAYVANAWTRRRGIVVPSHREYEYRTDLANGGTARRIGEMEIGEVETWNGPDYIGTFKLVGKEPVGPHNCRQTEWTMTKTKTKSSVSMFNLHCFRAETGKWIRISF